MIKQRSKIVLAVRKSEKVLMNSRGTSFSYFQTYMIALAYEPIFEAELLTNFLANKYNKISF